MKSFTLLYYFAAITTLLTIIPSHVEGFASVHSVSNTTIKKPTTSLPLLHLRKSLCLFGGSTTTVQPSSQGVVLNTGVGGIVFAGGLMGYIKKGSKASLIAGSMFGGLLMLSAYIISKNNNGTSSKTTTTNVVGNKLASIISGLLTYAMGKKFLRSRKFIPAGFIASMGVITFVFNLIVTICSSSSSSSSEKVSEGEEDKS